MSVTPASQQDKEGPIRVIDDFWGSPIHPTMDYTGSPIGCWVWLRGRSSRGYGTINVGSRTIGAHRIAWELANGPIPEGLSILHKCDNPSCVNPRHLFLGTNADNRKDAQIKGRLPAHSGEKNPHARLTWEEVREIRQAYTGKYGEKIRLAEKYEIDETVIGRILHNKAWKQQRVRE